MNNQDLQESQDIRELINQIGEGHKNSEKLNITQDWDDFNTPFCDYSYFTITDYSDFYAHLDRTNLKNHNFGKQNLNDVKEIEVADIEDSLSLTIKQVENISAQIKHCCSQKETLISTQMSQLSNNKTLLKDKIVLHSEKDLEIITMLIMLLVKQNPNPNFFSQDQEEQLDMHMKILFQIHTSYEDYCQAKTHIYFQNQDQIKQEIDIILEKDFTTYLIKKLDDD
ncbi:unnamed protein product (macronuclear) [Paramecium tetraurelia]|uniref:Uncharacterized protein n=1 Tax=Paramecium tetraurelia TaxID=5888 RepID=A0E2A4_PARTE|nr:uncharacterized protein GSPATT00022593001 [Paramecium tetraurelia]CAK89421.1 unnamed protein product [Paramecium tetraurelia]|eukprot:XP_001456818.1 hypothetical protein (macronuclear) [Paramecium tetraurelia strain d4-2]